MDIIGEMLKSSREEKSLSLEEVSSDLDIKKDELEAIESGISSGIKDVYVLKDHIYDYAKYLGLDVDEIMDDFNEFMFQTTSKIPTEVIERISKQKEKEASGKDALSPYTEDLGKYKDSKSFKLIYILIPAIILIGVVLYLILR